ncbi:Phosphatidylinositol-3-phosphatase SAC1 [Halotydeus destructor]|nr:Phosphatidylinositol-3-phosphatase SAC1 [Halotydeus destructor]
MSVLTEINLHVTPEKIYLNPVEAANEVISIDRLSHDIVVEGLQSQIPLSAPRKVVRGIVGIIRLIAGPYLILITESEEVGTIYGQKVFKVLETEIISYSRTTLHLTEEQLQFNSTYLSMVKTVLNTQNFYYCSNYDLSHSLQRLFGAGPEFLSQSLFDRADQRFLWNRSLMTEFDSRPELKKYCLPLIHGFVSIENVAVNNKSFKLILISRRNVRRAGCRLLIRGLDANGDPANYVETEQIVEHNGHCSSFVQVRGSIPIYWSQMPTLMYKPKPVPTPNQNHLEGFKKHMESLIQHYGPVIMLNLIDQKGDEDVMEKKIAEIVKQYNSPAVRYEAFDFHHECRKMRWDRLSILMDRISKEQDEYKYFLLSPERAVMSLQEGIFRTNCIDSLDRTNVVQGLLAKRSLEAQLKKLGVISDGEKIENHNDFEFRYRNVWADNADVCSVQYSGTGALKTDFTRTGKRTHLGALRDGKNSVMRYYKNNFADGFRQDAIDLFLGNYRVDENEGKLLPCPLFEKKDWKYLALPVILLGSIAMFFFSLFLPTEHSTETFIYLLFWAGMASVTLTVIGYYGTEFVDYPKLCEVKSKKKSD